MRTFAASWVVLGLAAIVSRVLISVVVFRRVEYTLTSVAELSLLPAVQAAALAWATARGPLRAAVATWRKLFSSSVVVVVLMVGVVTVAGFVSLAWGAGSVGVDPRRALGMVVGTALLTAAALLVAAGVSASPARILPAAGVCAVFGVLWVAAAAGFRPRPGLPIPLMVTFGWSIGAVVSVPLLLRAAGALRRLAAAPMEVGAAAAAVSAVVLPLGLYLRPYLGVCWLDASRVALTAAAFCCVIAGLMARKAGATVSVAERSASGSAGARSIRWLVVWFLLGSTYIAGWLILRAWLDVGWLLSFEAAGIVVVVPLVQLMFLRFAAMVGWLELSPDPSGE